MYSSKGILLKKYIYFEILSILIKKHVKNFKNSNFFMPLIICLYQLQLILFSQKRHFCGEFNRWIIKNKFSLLSFLIIVWYTNNPFSNYVLNFDKIGGFFKTFPRNIDTFQSPMAPKSKNLDSWVVVVLAPSICTYQKMKSFINHRYFCISIIKCFEYG